MRSAARLALLVTGLVLMRFGWFEIRDPRARAVAYWLHALLPLAAASLFVWHREKGGRFRAAPRLASFAAVAALSSRSPSCTRWIRAEERHAAEKAIASSARRSSRTEKGGCCRCAP